MVALEAVGVEDDGLALVAEAGEFAAGIVAEVREGNLVAGRRAEARELLVAGDDEVETPAVGPLADERLGLVEMFEVVDEDDRRHGNARVGSDFADDVKDERGVLAAGPHDGRTLVCSSAVAATVAAFSSLSASVG